MNSPTESQIQQAIADARAGDNQTAHNILHQIVRQEPQNARAWYLLSQVAETEAQAIDCLERVLQIQPDNVQALERLEKLKRQPAIAPSKPKKKTNPWLWVGLVSLGGICSLICLCILVVAFAGVMMTPTPVAALPSATLMPNQLATIVLPPTWTPTFTPELQASATLAPTIELSPIPPSATIVPVITALPEANGASSGNLQAHFIDVGQGDATLILSPDGKTVLIDGGETNTGVVQYLQSIGINHIDLMIATHPHADHIGGLVQVLQAMSVATVVTNGQLHTTSTYENFLDAIASAKAEYAEVQRGDTLAAGNLVFEVLYPVSNTSEDMNNNSIVLRLMYGNIGFLFMGDAGKEAEMSILASGLSVQAQILKVGHHGSNSASSPVFLAQVKPEVGIYFAGKGNPYGHPHQETLEALQAVGAQIYGTDKNGTIIVTTDGNSYKVAVAKQNQLLPTPTLRPTATAASGSLALDIVSVTSPVAAGEKATLTAKTVPGAKCTITVYYKSGPSEASGLEPKIANSNGIVSWTWKVAGITTQGTWRIVVTANLNGQTVTRETTFEVR